MSRLKYGAILAVLALGCGGRIEEFNPPDNDAGADSSEASPMDSAADAPDSADSNDGQTDTITPTDAPPGCEPVNGVAVCGGMCGDTCATGGCTQYGVPGATGGSTSTFGTCRRLFDVTSPSKFQVPCSVCYHGGELCTQVRNDPSTLGCVPPELCQRLDASGFHGACVYTDKTAWSPTDVIPTPPCPANGRTLGLCGGACGDCTDPEMVCTGRSPTHPFGICAWTKNPAFSGSQINVCSLDPMDLHAPCPSDQACVVFQTGNATSQAIEDKLGFCMPKAGCLALRASFPGGVRCTQNGTNIP